MIHNPFLIHSYYHRNTVQGSDVSDRGQKRFFSKNEIKNVYGRSPDICRSEESVKGISS